MGILDRIFGRTKQKKKKKEEKEEKKKGKTEKKKKEKPEKKQPKSDLKQMVKEAVQEATSVEPVGTSEKDLTDTKELLKAWEQQVSAVQDHPLSQAKIINSQLLARLTDVLKSMDNRLEDLVKLDEIIDLLERGRHEIAEKGVVSDNLDKAIRKLQLLSVKDKKVLEVLKENDKMTASQMAEKVDVSRSTCSSRLNRLYTLGILDKEPVGKRIFYKIKEEQNF